jgi:dolichol-phosphate mannosyltransferase
MRKATIVIPTYNEKRNIVMLINKINEVIKKIDNWNINILIVDSKSPDNTSSAVKEIMKLNNNIDILETEKEGMGRAYTQGFKYAISKFDPYVIFEMDADLSHDPEMLPFFLQEIEKGSDFVIGSRYIKGGSIPKDWAFHRKLFSVVGNLIIRFGFAKLKITDWTSGYRAIKTWIIKDIVKIIDRFSGYVFQVAVLDNAFKKNAVVSEIPINFTDRKEGMSKINSFQFIYQTILYVLVNSSFIKYAIVGSTGAIVDFGFSYIFIEVIKFRIWLSTLISVELAIIYNFLLNNFWSFSHKKIESTKTSYIKNFIKFRFLFIFLGQNGGIYINFSFSH